MALSQRQELRQKLLLEAMNSVDDLQAALALAQEMERFVIDGVAEGGEISVGERAPSTSGKGPVSGKKPRWTTRDEQRLRELWTSGQPLPVVAQQLGRTEVSINTRARQLSLPPRAERQKEPPTVVQSVNGGFAPAQTAANLAHDATSRPVAEGKSAQDGNSDG